MSVIKCIVVARLTDWPAGKIPVFLLISISGRGATYGLMLTAWHNPTVTADIARWASQSARCGAMTTPK